MRRKYRGKWYVDPAIELYELNDKLIGLDGWDSEQQIYTKCIQLDFDYKKILKENIKVRPVFCEEELLMLVVIKE